MRASVQSVTCVAKYKQKYKYYVFKYKYRVFTAKADQQCNTIK